METNFQEIRFDRPAPFIARVTLARPERLNAYTMCMCRELCRAFELFDIDPTID